MIHKILLTLISPFIIYLLIVLIKDSIPWIRYLLHYKSQKIKFHYTPVFGWMGLYTGKKETNVEPFKEILSGKHKSDPIIATNEFNSTRLNFMLNSPDIIKEFFIKELEYTIKSDTVGSSTNYSFFWRNGKKAMEERAIFNKFFEPVNLKKIVPAIRKVIDRNFLELKKKLKIGGKKIFKKVDLTKVYEKIFSEVVDTILFGEDANDTPKVDGTNISLAMENLARMNYNDSLKNPFNLLTFMYFSGSKFISINKSKQELEKKIHNTIRELINRRSQLKKEEELGINMIDLMLKHNNSCGEEEKLSEMVMIATVMLFQLAGIDTSKNSTEGIVNLLSLDSEKRKKFVEKGVKEVKKRGNGVYESYEENEYLQCFVDEALRLFGPAVIIFPRRVVKEVKIGGFRIKKGDKITIPIYALHNSDKNFDNFEEFSEERFKKENSRKIKKNSYLPFSAGRRGCVGRYLALMLVKMNVCALFDHFEVIGGYETKRLTRFSYGVENCFVDLKLKE